MNNEQTNIGWTPLPGAERDAIHVAVIPVVAGEILKRGDWVVLKEGLAVPVRDPLAAYEAIGVVDPFREDWEVAKGERFWLYIKPRSITSIRHEWTHPAFPRVYTVSEKEASERWLKDLAARHRNISYVELIETAVSGEGITQGDDESLRDEMADDQRVAEFWHHIEVLTGKGFDEKHRAKHYFSCSC